jgi:hypothetical protein
MAYPAVLEILMVFFGIIGALALGCKAFAPEPPPRGGVSVSNPKISFKEYHRARSAQQGNRDAVIAQRRAS